MRIGLVASPFIPVPPLRYGGTELFVATLAEALVREGHQVIVYANGESRVACEVRWIYARSEWPIADGVRAQLKDLNHSARACADLEHECDIIHVNNTQAVTCSVRSRRGWVCTLHHPNEPVLSELYAAYPDVEYVAISHAQARQETLPRLTAIHHGLRLSRYHVVERKQPYLAFLGRMAPVKGPHLAIEVARKSGIPLKLAGEIQPAFADYWESEVKPHVDGRFIEYVGEADLSAKNELLGQARALVFPIRWHEPFGLIMIEAMACGTPVVAFRGGSVEEIVDDGVSGWICRDVDDMASRLRELSIPAHRCRASAERRFSDDVMARKYVALYERARARADSARPSAALVKSGDDRAGPKLRRDDDRVEVRAM